MFSHRALKFFVGLPLAVCALFFALTHNARSTASNKEPVWHSHPGPWGDLEIHSIYLDAPDWLLATMPKPNSVPRWFFEGGTEAAMRELFTRAGLPEEMQNRLFDPQRMMMENGALVLFPKVEDLEAMTEAQRVAIYPVLAKSDLNEFHKDPVFISGGNIDDWLFQSGLTQELQQVVRKMAWHRGKALVFSDVRTLLNHAHSDAELQQIFKVMTRVRTLVVELKLPPGADVKPLIDYWSADGHSIDIIPMLKATAARDNITKLDITHLMPPIGRRRLYTYPTLDLIARGRMPDCHWTSLNFFSSTAHDYYLDTRLASENVKANYMEIQPPYKFGDMLFVQNDAGAVIHSCIFVADDIVFTKNGENPVTPWILMWLDDVKSLYMNGPEWHVQGYRLKPQKPSPF
jgi:hypothetical protein